MRKSNYRKNNSCYATSLNPAMRLDLYKRLVAFYESVQEAYPNRPRRQLIQSRNLLKLELAKK